MPIFHDRIADQIEELLPEFYQDEGPRFISFVKSYFEFLEKGQLIYKDAADIDYIGLEDGTVAGEAFNSAGERGNLLQESGTYAPSSIANAKFNYEMDVDTQDKPVIAKTSFEKGEYVVGSKSSAVGRIDVIGTTSNLYIEQFSEAQFEPDEIITGKTSGMTATVDSFKASPLHAANNLLSYADVDKTSGDFLEYFRRDFMPFIDRDVLANKRLLQKHVKDLYLSKGTKESYEFLFRILYKEEAEVTDPGKNVIKPSTAEFSEPQVMRIYAEKDATPYKRGLVKKIVNSVVVAKAYINDASGISGTNDATNAYELELVTPYVGTFNHGDEVIISDRDGFRVDLPATVRGVMLDIDPTESSVYVGQEAGSAGDIEDIIRLEEYESIYIVDEDGTGDKILFEDEDELIFEQGLGGENYQARPIGLETGTGVGILLSEESVYDENGNLTTDYAILDENTDLYPHYSGGPATRKMGGGVYSETASAGSLYSESETFNYNSPRGGSATQSINVIGSIGRGGITDIVIDDVGSGYSQGDSLVFINTGTGGDNAEAEVSVTDSYLELENATTPGVYVFEGDGSNTVFEGIDTVQGLTMGFDPRKVKVFVAGTEQTRETQFTTDRAGTKVTMTSAPSNGASVEIHSAPRRTLLEQVHQFPLPNGAMPAYTIANEADGAIAGIKITSEGLHYTSLPKVFMGGYIYYDEMTTGTTFTVGEVLTSSNSKTFIVAKHDTEKKRILVYKRTTDPAGTPTGTVTGGTSSAVCSISSHTVTGGSGAKLWAYGDEIGSIKKLKMQTPGHNFVQGGIGNYKQNAIVKDISASLTANTTITANLTGATGTVSTFDGDLNLLKIDSVKGVFNEGDYCTTSDNKNFVIGKINPCTARGKLGTVAKLDGNYTDDIGFPSVDSQRIHDNKQYQDYSYLIKVGRSINEYRSLVKSLLSPAGTIFFGEVSVRNTVDARATVYNVNFDGTQTTRSFIPTLIIGSKARIADIQLEDATIGLTDEVFGAGMGRVELEDDQGVITTERFICSDTTAADHTSHTVTDQSSGNPYVIGTDTVEETDRNFSERVLTAEVQAKGHRVTKEIEIYPHWNQHKISYSTLNNALAIGTRIKGATSGAQGIVCAHDTTNKFIIVDRNTKDYGEAGSQFTGTEIIQNTGGSTNYFTATSIELHYIPEDIVVKQDPTAITADSSIISANQKISNGIEGGGDAYDHTDYLSGFQGRGKVLVAGDHSEAYDSEMRQRKVNIISSPIFTQANTQRGRTYSAVPRQLRTLNTQNSRTLGSNTTANNSNGTALRIDSAWNTTTLNSNSFGHRPAGQKLYESTNFLVETLITEDGLKLTHEPDSGQCLGENFSQDGAVILEDGNNLMWEDATVSDETLYFVSEESSQNVSYNLISESSERLIDETDSLPLLSEDALMIGQKQSNQVGPTLSDLGHMMFTENYAIMQKVQLDGGTGISSGDDLLLETGEHMILESPSEGIKISDISSIYPSKFVTNIERDLGHKMNLTHSAVIQTG